MRERDSPTPIENLTTRAFVLLRELIKTGKLSEAKTIELVEIIKEMPATSFSTEVKAELKVLNAKLESQNTKYNVLIWVMGIGFTLLLAFNFFGN